MSDSLLLLCVIYVFAGWIERKKEGYLGKITRKQHELKRVKRPQ